MTNRLPLRFLTLLAALPATLAAWAVYAQTPLEDAATTAPGIVLLPEDDATNAAQPLPRPDPATLLNQATELLLRRRSITCKLRHQAEFFDRSFVGSGSYAQGPTSSRWMRYELRMQVGDREVHQLQVNDGRYLWQQRQYKEEPTLQRIDVDKVLASAGHGNPMQDATTVLGLGGIGRLIAVLRNYFDFNVVFRSKLKADPTDIDVYGIEGRWRPEVLKNMNFASSAELRKHIPDRVVMYFGCDDFFPYRFEFHRESPGASAGAAPTSKPLLALDLFDVRFDTPLDESMFRFNAGSQPFMDITGQAATR